MSPSSRYHPPVNDHRKPNENATSMDHETLARIIAAVDDANRADPSSVELDGQPTPLALAHGILASRWVDRLYPERPDTWFIAARAHHLRRWEYPRSSAPAGRAGYLTWRAEQKRRHARLARTVVADNGGSAQAAEDVARFVERAHLTTDAGCQSVEDGACFAFIITQLDGVTAALDRDHLARVLDKTIKKMSTGAVDLLTSADLGGAQRPVLDDAIQRFRANQ